jgi:methylmalonyl-CoA/ethylmalonyl-CoA epimerase
LGDGVTAAPSPIDLPSGLAFHHIGVACRDLDAEERVYTLLGYAREGADFRDPIQGIGGRFLFGGGPRLELLIELPGSGVLTPWLRKGIRLYHLAWEAENLREASASLQTARAKVVADPVPAVAFGGREITFLMLPNLQLIELISRW